LSGSPEVLRSILSTEAHHANPAAPFDFVLALFTGQTDEKLFEAKPLTQPKEFTPGIEGPTATPRATSLPSTSRNKGPSAG